MRHASQRRRIEALTCGGRRAVSGGGGGAGGRRIGGARAEDRRLAHLHRRWIEPAPE
jgi:hypothetical protein